MMILNINRARPGLARSLLRYLTLCSDQTQWGTLALASLCRVGSLHTTLTTLHEQIVCNQLQLILISVVWSILVHSHAERVSLIQLVSCHIHNSQSMFG